MTRVLVIGAGGHARPVIEALVAGGHGIAGLRDDAPGGPVLGHPRLGPVGLLESLAREGIAAAVAIGDNATRARIGARLASLGIPMPAVIHPAALISPSASIGPGAQLMARAVIGPEAAIGALALVNTGAIVEHECRLGEAAHLGPGAVLCGGVTVGARALVAAGAVVRPGLAIGEDAVVAPGAAVAAGVPPGGRWGGVPAHPL